VAEWIFALSEGLAGYSCADYDTISQLGWLPTPADRRPAYRHPPAETVPARGAFQSPGTLRGRVSRFRSE
jgi:hypothetical protein